ncbi:MFS general substrate transporter [Daedalea quercina L-15889]|uniref:MFS general substrate transporter n=1 Tax=Daedalea quercina L-15889 TaxID=1314783 RepID=A0A165KML0_9APHY|nr:MFS general substrate transporter [Daedalea quercina L-15889]
MTTVVVGTIAFSILVDFPETATFITDQERAFIAWTKSVDNMAVGEEEHLETRHVIAVLSDWQIWMQIVLYWCICAPLNGITLFLPSIISSFGYDTAISQLLTVPPYICASKWQRLRYEFPIVTFTTAIGLVVFALWSDHIKMRSPFIFAGLLISLVGFAINISDAPIGVKYFGTFFCVTGSYAAFPGVVAWLGNNLAGQYKRAIGMALQMGLGNMNGILASNLYLSSEAPRYIRGHGLEIMFLCVGLTVLPFVVSLYRHVNGRRAEEVEKGVVNHSEEQLRHMGDRSPHFRYML